jgi:hypothetical protein
MLPAIPGHRDTRLAHLGPGAFAILRSAIHGSASHEHQGPRWSTSGWDPIKAVVNVQNYMFAVSQRAQTSVRSIIGQSEMDQLLAERDSVNRELRRIIDERTEGPWGDPCGAGGDQGRLAAGEHEAVDVAAGRGGAGTAGQDYHRNADGEQAERP